MDTVGILISCALFVLNLIIFLMVRSHDRNQRNFHNQAQQIKNFRSEVSATQARMHELTQDCTDSVQSHVDKARDTVEIVNTCLDRLSQHQKDLTALEGICIDYKRALEKLKLQTEQAENRILVVQAEIRKAESVSDFVKNFHSESDILEQQLADLKSEYLRLVTSTQESLKQQANLQRNENGEMLSAFNAAIERQKQQFVDFVNTEKEAFVRECAEQTRIANAATEEMSAGKREVDDAVRNASASVATMRDSLKAMLDQTSGEMDAFREEVKSSFEGFRVEIGGEDDALKQSFKELEEKLDKATVRLGEKKDECAAALVSSFDDLSRKMDQRREELSNHSDDTEAQFQQSLEKRLQAVDAKIEKAVSDVDQKVSEMKKEREEYGEACRVSYREALSEELEKANEAYERISKLVTSQTDILAQRSKEVKDAISIISESGVEKIQDAGTRLTDLSVKIRESEGQLSRIQETVTNEREELYKLQGEHEKLDKELKGARDDLKSTKADLASAKEKSIKAEAELGRLNLDAEKARAKAEKEEKKAKEKKAKEEERAASLFEEFPDEFLGEEEEVPLDD